MKVINDFMSLFTQSNVSLNDLNPIEDLYIAKVSCNINKYINPDINAFLETSTLICNILEINTFEFSFKVIDRESLNFNVHPDLVRTFFSSYSENKEKIQEIYRDILSCEFHNIEENEFLALEIVIKKPMELEKINRVYFFHKFVESFNNLNLIDIIGNTAFNNIDGNIIFLIDQEIPSFFSKDIYFVHSKEDLYDIDLYNIDYKSLLLQHRLNCHFINSSLGVTPYTFRLIQRSECDIINIFFDKLEMIISLIYISNYSELSGSNSLKLHISGYKLINEEIDFNELGSVSKSFFNIFDWIYKENNISEKLELARNIVSLDYKDTLNDIDDRTLASIKSNYNIYLKENVDRYIELKTQITENILSLSLKSKDIIDDFSSNFKNAFITNLSFVFSILILNIINDTSNTTNIFNEDLSKLYLIITGISLLYLIFSIINTKKDLKHYDSTFYNLKDLYSGLLSEEDLDNTFNNNILLNDKIYIKKRIRSYSIFWTITLIFGLIGLYFLSQWFTVTVNNIFTYPIKEL